MDCVKIGRLIARLRKERNLTQKDIAEELGIQNKTVSKWECGLGCPDISLWPELSAILGVDMEQMMEGEITSNKPDSGNIDKVRFYVCPSCGNILVSTGSASISCCGRKLEYILPEEISIEPRITIEEIDTDYFITFDHPMNKEHYLSFVACVKSDRVFLNRLYPEQSPTCRIPISAGGKLYVYCVKHGLMVYPGNL
ncbi:helix-turn-helix domain-containing protein [Kineothrix sp. MB12-C1]|uniref:helix-turn-helix domain-containing protein n=1 Tax=Kineothrix sp. MB12-C1 TaxID=3070215 RepID=UPI0027D342EF|nr:helix-turn-helix domain-containing protein [Kineothrix sp. MB12-C1]WMC91436.1 helix-turn-helix domain-containing protein [Kineothrix sp. MB12-C1]